MGLGLVHQYPRSVDLRSAYGMDLAKQDHDSWVDIRKISRHSEKSVDFLISRNSPYYLCLQRAAQTTVSGTII